MARTFDSTTDRITFGTTAMPVIGSMSFWFKPTWAQADNAEHELFDVTTGAIGTAFRLTKYTDNTLYLGWILTAVGDFRVIVLTANYTITQNAWNHLAITWDDTANVTKAYLNGAQIGSSTSTLVTHTTTGVKTLGNYSSGSGDINAAADFAEWAVWEAVLDAAEITALSKAVSPQLVRTGALTDYAQLIREMTNHFGTIGTDTTTAVAVHPRMIYPAGGRKFGFKTPTVVADALPMAWQQYRQRRVA